jgi:hypothetical protein
MRNRPDLLLPALPTARIFRDESGAEPPRWCSLRMHAAEMRQTARTAGATVLGYALGLFPLFAAVTFAITMVWLSGFRHAP